MRRKPSLYALVAALTLGWARPGLAREPQAEPADAPPCGACITLGLTADGLREPLPEGARVALVAAPGELEAASDLTLDAVRAVVVDLHGGGDVDALDLAVRRALTGLRARRPGVTLGAFGPPAALDALLARDLAAYVDFVVAAPSERAARQRWAAAHPGLAVWRTAALGSFAALLDASAAAAGDPLLVWPSPAVTPELAEDLARLAEFFPVSLVPAADGGAACRPAEDCVLKTFERPETRERIHWLSRKARAGGTPSVPVSLVLAAPRAEVAAVSTSVGAAPGVADSVLPLAPQVSDRSGRLRLFLPLTAVSSLIIRVPPAEPPVVEAVAVAAARELTVEEIVARHQAAAARQAALVRTSITHARMTLTFEVPAFPAPVVVAADTVALHGDGPAELIQRNLTVNGVAFGGARVPRLPIVEPERVAAPPLAITLSRSYRYRLEGRARVGGTWTYVVAFEPATRGVTLFEGRAWIDQATFGLVRVDAAQTGLRGPITASRQVDELEPVALGGERVWLLARSETRQLYQGAGVTTPIVRVMRVIRHEINPPDLERRRRAAHASPDVMLRDTPAGWRYLTPGRGNEATRGEARAVAGRGTRVGTLAAGVIVDPNITRPLPFAGINYTDFDLAGSGAQLNAFFGGAYGQAALHAPSLGGTRWQAAASGFAVLASFHDRAFRDGRERYDENLRQRPAQFRAGVVRPIAPETGIRAEYVFDLTAFDRADTTAPDFVPPARQVVHGLRFAIEAQRGGWRLEGWWNPARRSGWRPWGFAGSDDDAGEHAAFQRAGASASRSWTPSSGVLARVEAAVMGGADLDRFSRYAFGTFDNRLRGYPAASVRYDRGMVVRAAAAWQTGGRVRVDGFADAAVVREPGFGGAWRGYPGVGSALEAAGPLSLLLGLEWGYGIKGLDAGGTRGTHVFRVTAYKVF